MKPALSLLFGFCLAIGGSLSRAQSTPIPFAQLQHEAQLSAMRMASNPGAASMSASEPIPSGSSSSAATLPAAPASSSSFSAFKRVPAGRSAKLVDARYLWLNSLHLTMALADIETTQHCINDHTCREGNPLLPSSNSGKIAVSFGLVGYTTVTSYWLKKHKSKEWWLPPTVGIASHAVGLASGLVHQ